MILHCVQDDEAFVQDDEAFVQDDDTFLMPRRKTCRQAEIILGTLGIEHLIPARFSGKHRVGPWREEVRRYNALGLPLFLWSRR